MSSHNLLANVDFALFAIVTSGFARSAQRNAILNRITVSRVFRLLCNKVLELSRTTFFLENPVVLVVNFVAMLGHDLFEQAPEIVVVGLLFELQVAAVLKVLREFFWGTPGYLADRSLNFLLFDSVILLILVLACKTLPW